jgi:hypothetical protein
MALNIIKLAVGADSIEDLIQWHDWQMAERASRGLVAVPVCDTRMAPKRRDEVLGGGSLYWVIKGVVLVRQTITDIVVQTGEGGQTRCELHLEPVHHRTEPLRRKAFQGWRYLEPRDAPLDLGGPADGGGDIPDALRRELIDLGAW